MRSHIHLPVTYENGDILVFADVTLLDPVTGSPVQGMRVWDGPYEMALEKTWPVTFAPANIDLWVERPGRFDLHVVGPDGYSTIIRGVDFLPHPDQQVIATNAQPVSTAAAPNRWLKFEGGQLRWVDPGLISPHAHDGGTADSTLLESVDSRQTTSILGFGATAAILQGTVVGGGSSATGAGGTVVGPASTAVAGAVTLGDNQGSGQAADDVFLPFSTGGITDAYVKGAQTLLRSASIEAGETVLGESVVVPGSPPPGATDVVWIAADLKVPNLELEGDVSLAQSGGTVGFFGSEGTTQGASPAGATGVLADLVAALEAYGLIAP